MHNFAEKYVKILDICKKFAGNLVNEHGNMPRRGVVPRFSDLEVIALSITAECLSIDCENYLFDKEIELSFDKEIGYVEQLFKERSIITNNENIKKRLILFYCYTR